MKKLFACMMVMTILVTGQSVLFAGEKTNESKVEAYKIEAALAEANTIAATTIAIEAQPLTPEQEAEMAKLQKEYEAKLQEVCKQLNYTEEELTEKMINGTLTEEEQKVLEEAGILMAASTVAVISMDAATLTEEELKNLEEVSMLQVDVASPAKLVTAAEKVEAK